MARNLTKEQYLKVFKHVQANYLWSQNISIFYDQVFTKIDLRTIEDSIYLWSLCSCVSSDEERYWVETNED